MSYASNNLGDWKSSLKKARDFVHKFFPRELSPTRMLEKYATDTKKKNAAKLASVQSASVAKNAADEAALQSKITNLQAQALPVFSMAASAVPPASVTPAVPKPKAETDWTSTGLAVALALGAALVIIRSRK